MPIDHFSIPVSDLDKSTAFYSEVLKPLGYKVFIRYPIPEPGQPAIPYGAVGLTADKPDFWIHHDPQTAEGFNASGAPSADSLRSNGPRNHVAFKATHAQVDEVYAIAVKLGAKDNGAPGLRPQYHPTYYGAFFRDPDGHNVEVVSHTG